MTSIAYGFATTGYRPIEARERLGSAGVAALVLALLLALALIRYQPMLVATPVPRLPVNFVPIPPEPVPPLRVPPKREAAQPDAGGTPAPRAERPIDPPSSAPTRPAPEPAAGPSAPDLSAALPAPPAPPPAASPASAPAGEARSAGTGPASDKAGDGLGGEGRGSAAGTGNGRSDTDTTLRVFDPIWDRIYINLNRFYPKQARAKGVRGFARLVCQVTLERRLENCQVYQESPAGWNFGDAALAYTRELRAAPIRVNGTLIDRAWVRFSITFAPPSW